MTTAVTIAPAPILQFFNNLGAPNVGGSILTQVGGLNYATYQDSAGTVPLPNPIPLNSRGEISNAAGLSTQLFLASNIAYVFTMFDVNGNQLNQATYVANTDVSGIAGAGMVGFSYGLGYATGTVGRWLQDLALAAGSTFIGWVQTGTSAVVRTLSAKARETVSVLDFGADPTGVADSYFAFAATWAAVKSTGATINIPPGAYLLNTQWTLDVDLTLPHNYAVLGYGAQIISGPLVTGHAIRVYRGYNNFGVKFEGLHFNQRGNVTVNGCIQAQGATQLRIVKCSMEAHNTKATYAAIELAPYTVGNDNTNTFWTLIDGFSTRQRTGGDGSFAAVGIRLAGPANATKIVNCSFNSVTDAIRIETDGTSSTIANATVILHNEFEGVTNCITVNTASPAIAMPTGLRVAFNRVETATTFINIVGAAVTNTSYPPNISSNYLTAGSVTNYLVNANNQYAYTYEPSYFGVGARNVLGGPADFKIITDGTGHNLILSDLSMNSNYAQGHIVLGTTHLWVEGATGKLRIKGSTPTFDADGVVVGTQT